MLDSVELIFSIAAYPVHLTQARSVGKLAPLKVESALIFNFEEAFKCTQQRGMLVRRAFFAKRLKRRVEHFIRKGQPDQSIAIFRRSLLGSPHSWIIDHEVARVRLV